MNAWVLFWILMFALDGFHASEPDNKYIPMFISALLACWCWT